MNLSKVWSSPFPMSLIIDWMQCSKKTSNIFFVQGFKVLDNNFLTGVGSKEAGYPSKECLRKLRSTQIRRINFHLSQIIIVI